jgi:hypothetical protein
VRKCAIKADAIVIVRAISWNHVRKSRVLHAADGVATGYEAYHLFGVEALAREAGDVRLEVLMGLWYTRLVGLCGIDTATAESDLRSATGRRSVGKVSINDGNIPVLDCINRMKSN